MKRLALFLDGTWNNVDDNTNVYCLSKLLADRGRDGTEQVCYYDSGVGTGKGENVRGGALGFGLSENVEQAYQWLIGNYEEGDQIFVFGFSRGAYTARSVTGLIARCGLLRRGAQMTVEQVYERYRRRHEVKHIYQIEHDKTKGITPSVEEELLLRSSRRVRIKMIGVWDTVGALGIPFGNVPGLSRRKLQFHNPNLSVIFDNAFHAVAVDEHREAFKPTLWTRFSKERPPPVPSDHPPLQEVEQRWFVGAHANVGGGIAGSDMSQVPLAWMQDKAEGLGLHSTGRAPLRGAEHKGKVADSFAEFMWGIYRLLKLNRRFHRPIGAPARAVRDGWSDPVNETIDSTVFDRWRSDPSYRPPGLVEWAKRRGVDPATLTSAVVAKTGRPVAGV